MKFIVLGFGMADWALHQKIGIRDGLRRHGLDAELASAMSDAEFQMAVLTACADHSPDDLYFIDGNSRITLPAGWAKFSHVVDHPALRLKDLDRERPDTLLGVVDQTHRHAARELGLRQNIVFLPHAGPEPLPNPRPPMGRDIGALFFGGLADDDTATLAQQLGPLDADWHTLCDDAVDRALAEGRTVYETLQALARAAGRDPAAELSREDIATLFTAAEARTSNRRRLQVLGRLDQLDLTIVSTHQPAALRTLLPRAVWHAPLPFAAILDLTDRSRLVLNLVGKFPSGAHDRVFDSMARATAVATDASSFLKRDFVDGRDLIFIPPGVPDAATVDALGAIAHDPTAAAAMAGSALAPYARGHTWQTRLLTIPAVAAAVRRLRNR